MNQSLRPLERSFLLQNLSIDDTNVGQRSSQLITAGAGVNGLNEEMRNISLNQHSFFSSGDKVLLMI